jgi:hypothetical protein
MHNLHTKTIRYHKKGINQIEDMKCIRYMMTVCIRITQWMQCKWHDKTNFNLVKDFSHTLIRSISRICSPWNGFEPVLSEGGKWGFNAAVIPRTNLVNQMSTLCQKVFIVLQNPEQTCRGSKESRWNEIQSSLTGLQLLPDWLWRLGDLEIFSS